MQVPPPPAKHEPFSCWEYAIFIFWKHDMWGKMGPTKQIFYVFVGKFRPSVQMLMFFLGPLPLPPETGAMQRDKSGNT